MDLASMGGAALNVLLMVISIFVFGGIGIGVVLLVSKYLKYKQFKIIIWGRDGFGNTTERTDEGGIFVDKKTKNKRLWLRKSKVGLSPDSVPYVFSNKKKVVYLLQTGLKNFRYIKPRVSESMLHFEVGEEDVNWAINAYERQKKLFSNSMLMQLMPWIILGFTSIIILVIFIYFFKEFGTLKDVAVAFQEAARELALAKSGTVVIN